MHDSGRWSPLVARLCAAGPWRLLDVRLAAPGELRDVEDGLTSPRHAPDGSTWCRVLIRPGMEPRDASAVLRHELGHVVHLAAVGVEAWPALARHRQFAERVADHIGARITPSSRPAVLMTAALAYRS